MVKNLISKIYANFGKIIEDKGTYFIVSKFETVLDPEHGIRSITVTFDLVPPRL